MSSASPSPAPKRHALGLPAGSVRALLALGVLALLWGMVLIAKTDGRELPLAFAYLQYLMLLIVAHYFAAHGKSIGRHLGESSALGLPAGSIRFLLLIGFGGLVVFQYMHNIKTEPVPSQAITILLALVVGGFFVGHILSALIRGASGGETPAWYQDVQAWFAILGLVGMVIVVLSYIINRNLTADLQISTEYIESALAAIVGFYFGARS
jgi:hypothetical protein